MPNSFDADPRGSSDRKLLVVGTCCLLVAALIAAAMVAKSRGLLDEFVRVDVRLVNIGDGLPTRSDVKFRGVLVGTVSSVTPSRHGQPNIVHVDIDPRYAVGIPNTVTARVVPSNIFAVSSVQLVDHGPGTGPLRTGAVIEEDKSLPTVLFQNVLAKLRELLAAVGRSPDRQDIGVLAAISEATQGRGEKLTDAGRDLNEVLAQLNTVISPTDDVPTTLSALAAASDGLRTASPELFDALDAAVEPMRTFAEKRAQLHDFLFSALDTTETLAGAFENQTDRMVSISTQLTPVLGVLADHSAEFHGVSTRLQTLANKFYDEAWNPDTKMLTIKAIVGFAPSRTYVRADCPRYGELLGPSCFTAPDKPEAPDLRPALESMGVELPPGISDNRPNYAPPRDSVRGAGPPPAHGPPPAETPAPPVETPAPSGPPLAAEVGAQPASFGGSTGPVGSDQEKQQLSLLLGQPSTAATELLLGPLVRGTTVVVDTEGEP